MRESLKDYCARCGRNALLDEWHPDKNGTLTSETVSYGSRKMIWWKCSLGHEWQSPPYTRVGKATGCPYCAGKKVAPGLDLQSVYPDIAAQWHPTRNQPFTPDSFLPGSHKSVWWQCADGHEWKALITSRTEGNGCPVCANKVVISGENDLQTTQPLLTQQWHPTKNGLLRPDQVGSGSKRKVWWRCEYGHEWQAVIRSRTEGSGCPVCTGKTVIPGENDLKTFYPEIASEWHAEKNSALCPEQVTAYSNKRVWWRCALGHEWQCSVAARTRSHSGCPFCAGKKVLPGFNDLKTVQPLVAAQWHPTMNGLLEPTMVTVGCNKRVWWKCSEGHEWRAFIFSRTGAQKCGCPVCAGRFPQRYKAS